MSNKIMLNILFQEQKFEPKTKVDNVVNNRKADRTGCIYLLLFDVLYFINVTVTMPDRYVSNLSVRKSVLLNVLGVD